MEDKLKVQSFKGPVGMVKAPKIFSQLGIFLLDGSGSMDGVSYEKISKAEAVNLAVRGLLTRMKVSKYSENFSFAILNFAEKPIIRLPVTECKHINDNDDYNPQAGLEGNTTKVSPGLELALKLADDFLLNSSPGGKPVSVLIFLMSDGMFHDPVESVTIASKIKCNPKIKIACSYFQGIEDDDQDVQKILQDISSDATTLYETTNQVEKLRTFFESSLSRVSGIRQITTPI